MLILSIEPLRLSYVMHHMTRLNFKFFCTLSLAALLSACASSPTPRYDAPVAPGHYRVRPGDTLYKISRQWGQSVANLTRWNSLANPNQIESGQVLRVVPPADVTSAQIAAPAVKTQPATSSGIRLQWPAPNVASNKAKKAQHGIEIAMPAGSPVQAAASGQVVYAGNGIPQYGNMIIVKHGTDFLTVYGYNRSLQVKEGAQVRAGEIIAESGLSGSSKKAALYFELRKSGQPIDAMKYFQ